MLFQGKVADINDAVMLDVSQKELSRPNNHLLKVLGKQDCSKSLSGWCFYRECKPS